MEKYNYRVIKVKTDDGSIKYIPQYTIVNKKKKKKLLEEWKSFYTIPKGTDEFCHCFHDTEEESWNRIDIAKNIIKLNKTKYEILEILDA